MGYGLANSMPAWQNGHVPVWSHASDFFLANALVVTGTIVYATRHSLLQAVFSTASLVRMRMHLHLHMQVVFFHGKLSYAVERGASASRESHVAAWEAGRFNSSNILETARRVAKAGGRTIE